MSLLRDIQQGLGALSLGWRLLATPGVRRLMLAPLLLTLAVYGVTLGLTLPPLLDWLEGLGQGSPQWVLDWFGWLISVLQFLLGGLLVLLIGWIGILLAGILSSPFYGRISALVEQRLTGRIPAVERSIGAEIAAGVRRELHKLSWSLPRMLGLILLGIIPGLNVLSTPLSFLLGAWVMAMQFADFAPENRGLEFIDTRRALGRHKGLTLGFGIPTAFGIGIPLINLLVAPAAVAGGTAVWLSIRGDWDGRSGLDTPARAAEDSDRAPAQDTESAP